MARSVARHANLRSIMKYVHVSQQQMDREMLRLDPRLAGDTQPLEPADQNTTIQ